MIDLIHYLHITPKIYKSFYHAMMFIMAALMMAMMVHSSLSEDAIPAEYLTIIYTKIFACALVVLLFATIICLIASIIVSALQRSIIIIYPGVLWVAFISLITVYFSETVAPEAILNNIFITLVITLVIGIGSQTAANVLKNRLWHKAFGSQNKLDDKGLRNTIRNTCLAIKDADEREVHLSEGETLEDVLKLDPSMGHYTMSIQNSKLTGRKKTYRTVTLSSGRRFQSMMVWDVYTKD